MWIQNNFDPKRHTKFWPINKEKYIGKHLPVICRSTWEKDFCNYLDRNQSILAWASESIGIPYIFKGKKKHYYPDFFIKIRNSQNEIEKYIIEIKPSKECRPPQKKGKKKHQTLINEKEVWEKNQAKWKAAEQYCKKRGYHFKILTEKNIYGK